MGYDEAGYGERGGVAGIPIARRTSANASVQALRRGTPLALHSYSGPVSKDPLTIRFKQSIGGAEPLRTGAYSKALTLTLSTTAP